MDATTTVKAEIKTWERDFRSQSGRNPTVEDMKALPHIAEKYKLYKKLTKEVDAKSERGRKIPDPPKTPPRVRQKLPNAHVPSPILSKSRPVASTTHEPTNNPFSPVKRKATNAIAPSSSANPFLTPLKAKRIPSRDPSSPTPSPPPIPRPEPAAAISKPRKRLRGEPVSPSPKPREKRRRLDVLDPSDKDDSASHSRSPSPSRVEEGDSFVDDSPVKAPASGKAFEPLFEEVTMRTAMPLSQPTREKAGASNGSKAFARAKTVPGGLFRNVKREGKDGQASLDLDVLGEDSIIGVDGTTGNGTRREQGKEQPVEGSEKLKKKRVLPGPKGLIPGKDDLFETNLPAIAGPSSLRPRNTVTSRKRSLSEATKDEKDAHGTSNAWNLLPPSPPPPDDSRWQKGKGKGKTKAGKGKSKKAKLSADGSDEEMEDDHSSSESADVKIVAWRGRPQSPRVTDADDTALELDPELQVHLRGRQANALSPQISSNVEKFEVDLPEEMRTMLALSPNGRERERKEEDLVKGLIQGLRKGGGEVWGPGEVGGGGEESDEDLIIEDDWEGEGVPWEVAEL